MTTVMISGMKVHWKQEVEGGDGAPEGALLRLFLEFGGKTYEESTRIPVREVKNDHLQLLCWRMLVRVTKAHNEFTVDSLKEILGRIEEKE